MGTYNNPGGVVSGADIANMGIGNQTSLGAKQNIGQQTFMDPNGVRGGGGSGAMAAPPGVVDTLAKGGSPSLTDPYKTPDYANGGFPLNKGMSPQVDPATGAPINKPTFAPTSQQTAANPQAWAGTSFDPSRNIMNENQGTPGGAFSTSMQGGGIGSQGTGYYGSNGPLDRSRFTPQGGAADAWYKQAFAGGNPNNISYLGFADQLGRQALEAAGGQWTNGDSVGSQINYLNSQAGQDWLKKLTTAPGTTPPPEGTTPPPAQTGPEAPKPPAPPPANTIDPSTPQGANQIMQAMLQGGFQHRDIPIQIRLMAMGVAGQNPLVNSMQGGGSLNPLMALLGIK